MSHCSTCVHPSAPYTLRRAHCMRPFCVLATPPQQPSLHALLYVCLSTALTYISVLCMCDHLKSSSKS